VFPQFLPNSTIIQYNPITTASLGTNFRTHSLFYNDNWRWNDRVTLNLGARWDKNNGVNGAGQLVADDSAFSPRVGVVWDPTAEGKWSVTANVAKYVAPLASTIADASSVGGNSTTLQWLYRGAPINPNGTASLTSSADAIRQVFDWFNAAGGSNQAPAGANVPGISVQIHDSLNSPNVLEYAAGVGRQLKGRAALRADFSYRHWRDFYSLRTDTQTGVQADQYGNRYDVGVMENTDAMKRRYAGLTLSGTYRLSGRSDFGGNYTLSRLWGNFDGENINAGPAAADLFQYPEYRQASWYAPEGDLSADQRHRSSLWFNYGVRGVEGLTLSLLEEMASGAPYGAIGLVNAIPFVTNPGYVTPQGTSSENYYFTARDAFRTEAATRTDFGASYSHAVATGRRHLDLFVQAQVLNLFNQMPLCGCGASVFANPGAVQLTNIGQGVVTNVTAPTRFAAFNPLTTAPVQGTNWDYNTTTTGFGQPLSRFAYQSPRAFRMTFGVRF
jgi:hypothetical protein